ncbi:MAG TPA: glycerophosphodiester phosphodiesterase family protein [Acetobacteraceae bacterium]|nr:glycerophosphodiester phosphodiesterase family protein [Acetobacteraceae bacterium]
MTRPCLIIGHRGARGLAPENTLAGFRAAIALGVDAVELDVALTADGVVVVSHDPRLNPDLTRDATGTWLPGPGLLIHTMPVAALAAYQVGRLRPDTDYAKLFPDQTPCDGEHIPTLDSVLRIDARVGFVVELKSFPGQPGVAASGEELAAATVAVADAAGVTPRIVVESFDWRGPRHLHRLRPNVRIALLTRAETVRDAAEWWAGPHPGDFRGSAPRAVAAEGASIWGPAWTDLTQDQVHEARELGLSVIPWTVNEPADMERLIGWGVDGIVTDRPDRASGLLRTMQA